MPWCPKCVSEYRETVELCPECQVPLVGELPDAVEEIDEDALLESEQELVVVVRGDIATCLDLRADLKTQRIPCAIVREAADPAAVREHRPQPVDVLVRACDVEAVGRILHERWQGLLEREGLATVAAEVSSEEELRCPACGHALEPEMQECPDCGLGLGSAD
jgi:hypothetical protein